MNLFESKLSELTTEDNSVYMEGVAQIFNTLFEADMAAPADSAPPADARNNLIQIITPLFDISDRIMANKNPYLMSFLQSHDQRTGNTSYPERQLASLAKVDAQYMSDKDLYTNVMSSFGELWKQRKLDNGNAFKQAVTNELRHLGSDSARETFKSILSEYMNTIHSVKTNLDQFAQSEEGKAMKKGQKSGEKLVRATKGRISGSAADAVADAEIAATMGAEAGTTTKGGRKNVAKIKKPEAPVDDKDPYINHIIGNVFKSNEPIIKINAPEKQKAIVLTRLKEGLEAVFNANSWSGEGNRVYKEAVEITSDADSNSILLVNHIPPALSTKGAAIDKHYILMYCLALDAISEAQLLPSNIEISSTIADRILLDQKAKPSNMKLRQLYPGKLGAFENKLPTRAEIMAILNTMAKKDTPAAEGEGTEPQATLNTASLNTASRSDIDCLCTAIQHYLNNGVSKDFDEFISVVPDLAADVSKMEGSDIESANIEDMDFMSATTDQKTPEYFSNLLKSYDIFNKLMAEPNNGATGMNYNGTAESLVNACIQNNANPESFDYYGTPTSSNNEMSQEDIMGSLDEIDLDSFGDDDDLDDNSTSYKTRGGM